jgi:hypothetical protein
MASRRKRSSAADAAAATAAKRRRIEKLEPNNICTYWPDYSTFDTKWVLLLRLFFIN